MRRKRERTLHKDHANVLRRLRYAQHKLATCRALTSHWHSSALPMQRSWLQEHERAVCKLLDELWGVQTRAAL